MPTAPPPATDRPPPRTRPVCCCVLVVRTCAKRSTQHLSLRVFQQAVRRQFHRRLQMLGSICVSALSGRNLTKTHLYGDQPYWIPNEIRKTISTLVVGI